MNGKQEEVELKRSSPLFTVRKTEVERVLCCGCHKRSYFKLLLSWLPISTHILSVHTQAHMDRHTHSACMIKQRRSRREKKTDREINEKDKKERVVDTPVMERAGKSRLPGQIHSLIHLLIQPSRHPPIRP